jgi:hypothetical protein
MDDHALTWRTDGFHLELDQLPDDASPLRQVLTLYALCTPWVIAAMWDAAFLPFLGTLLLPLPTALLWAVLRPRRIRIEVDHQRISVQNAFGTRRSVELRQVRDVNLRCDGLELVLLDGATFPLHAPTSYPRLSWLAGRIAELRDEVGRFEAEIRQRTSDVVQISRLTRAARTRS